VRVSQMMMAVGSSTVALESTTGEKVTMYFSLGEKSIN
jgi:hypothetical protein